MDEYVARRKSLFANLVSGDVVVLCASFLETHDRSINGIGIDNYFCYFTGFPESDAVAVFVAGMDNRYTLFHADNNDITDVIWHGERIGIDDVVNKYGADEVLSLQAIDELLPNLLVGSKKLYFNSAADGIIPQKVIGWLKRGQLQSGGKAKMPTELIHIGKFADEMRLRKSASEIAKLRKAAKITVDGVKQAMRVCKSQMFEYELEAELLYAYAKKGCCIPAFKAVVGSGNNSCVLHYTKNNAQFMDGDLVLVDTGATYDHYCADISRTFPISGKFTEVQRVIYQAVLDTQSAVIAIIAPGVTWDKLQSTAERVITEKLLALGILCGEINELLSCQAYKPFFMHKIGHWIGLDVHDVGGYKLELDGWRILEPGMVFTVEPGIYIASNQDGVESKWCGIGVRIEDVVVVTADGCEVITFDAPKTIAAIEILMK